MFERLFRKKSINAGTSGLKRCLSTFDLTLLGIGCIIGTGIFVLTGIAAANLAGPAVVLSFVISGLACTFAALSYAELSSSVGGCGSAYGYAYVTFGELIAWMIGWILLLEYGMSIAAVANGWSGYFQSALISIGLEIPELLSKGPIQGGLINLPASLIIILIMILLIIGVKESVKFNALMVLVKLIAIFTFIFVAAFNVDIANWQPFMPYGWFEKLDNGNTIGVLAGASIVFFAYVGFDAVSTAGDEAINPQRDLPRGIIYSLIFLYHHLYYCFSFIDRRCELPGVGYILTCRLCFNENRIQRGVGSCCYRSHIRTYNGHPSAILCFDQDSSGY